jgi:pimeloyl-ACP methyl ester carboxylesterase
VERLPGIARALPSAVRERFDIVSFDPRGTGGTTPIACADTLDPVFDASFSPRDERDRAELVDAVRVLASQCEARNGALLDRVGTVDAARDMDAVRAALGEEQLNFVGFSYGTYLGALYAAQHPERVRAFVLDGAIDPTAGGTEAVRSQVRGFEAGLDAFLDDCSEHRDCAFHRRGAAAAAYDELRRRVSAAPLAVTGRGERVLNDTRFDAAVVQLLYGGRASWTDLARALAAADDGDGARLLTVADRFVGRGPDGRDDDAVEAFWAISCLDGPVIGDVERTAAFEREARRIAPRLGAFVVNFSLACAVWPATAAAPAPPIDGVAPDALVIGARGDPATPLASARRLARALGDASLVIVDSDRHTALAAGNRCVDELVRRYLVAPESTGRPRVTRC